MKLNEYQVEAFSTCTQSSNNKAYMLFNLIGEIGEIVEKLNFTDELLKKKTNDFIIITDYFGKLAKGIRKNEVKIPLIQSGNELELMKEAGDCLWMLSGLCETFGWNLQEIADMNLNKLAKRSKDGVIVGEGDNR